MNILFIVVPSLVILIILLIVVNIKFELITIEIFKRKINNEILVSKFKKKEKKRVLKFIKSKEIYL